MGRGNSDGGVWEECVDIHMQAQIRRSNRYIYICGGRGSKKGCIQ